MKILEDVIKGVLLLSIIAVIVLFVYQNNIVRNPGIETIEESTDIEKSANEEQRLFESSVGSLENDEGHCPGQGTFIWQNGKSLDSGNYSFRCIIDESYS
ncbi:MAG: hypothetical protein R3251_01930, partial [Candidatus Spechtbacterales bacterium]|nr:hypothetical protein [Candidatus Spechtbacterales bacterium]